MCNQAWAALFEKTLFLSQSVKSTLVPDRKDGSVLDLGSSIFGLRLWIYEIHMYVALKTPFELLKFFASWQRFPHIKFHGAKSV